MTNVVSHNFAGQANPAKAVSPVKKAVVAMFTRNPVRVVAVGAAAVLALSAVGVVKEFSFGSAATTQSVKSATTTTPATAVVTPTSTITVPMGDYNKLVADAAGAKGTAAEEAKTIAGLRTKVAQDDQHIQNLERCIGAHTNYSWWGLGRSSADIGCPQGGPK